MKGKIDLFSPQWPKIMQSDHSVSIFRDPESIAVLIMAGFA